MPEAVGRAALILGLQVRKQAFTLAITDSFLLIAWGALCALIAVACMAKVSTQYKHVVADETPSA